MKCLAGSLCRYYAEMTFQRVDRQRDTHLWRSRVCSTPGWETLEQAPEFRGLRHNVWRVYNTHINLIHNIAYARACNSNIRSLCNDIRTYANEEEKKNDSARAIPTS